MTWQKNCIYREQHYADKGNLLDIENFLDRVFGMVRHTRTVNLMRKNILPDLEHSLQYRDHHHRLLALIRFYHLTLVDGTRAHLLGPVAVHPECQRQGLGKLLITEGLVRIDAEQPKNHLLFLVGHLSYYEGYGFLPQGTERYEMDGPIAPLVLLARCHDKEEIFRHQGRLSFLSLP